MVLQDFIRDILKEIFIRNILFDEDCRKYDFSSSRESQPDADVIFYEFLDDQKPKKLLDIEVKNPNVFEPLGSSSLLDYIKYKNEHIKDESKRNAPENSLAQIYGYLCTDNLKYGVLTSYNQTWYLKREKDELYVSEGIDKNLFLKSMNYFIYLALNE
jgi:hypothetical protein